MSKIFPYLIVLLIGIAVCFFWMKSCGKDSAIKIIQDSINLYKDKNDTLKIGSITLTHKLDSTTTKNVKDSLKFTHKIDSFTRVVQTLKSNFLQTRDTIASLHNRLNNAFINLDTIAVYILADSLNNELVRANNELFAWQTGRDSSENVKDSEIVRLNGIIVELKAQIVAFRVLLTECTTNASNLASSGNKAIKRAKLASLWNKIGGSVAALLAVLLIAHK